METVAIPDTGPQQILQDIFGYAQFRDGQEPVIAALMANRDVLAVMPTGAGKSLCFQIPGLLKGGLTLVVSPLVALMQDQVAALKLAGVAAEAINASKSYGENVDIWRRVVAGDVRILYMAPERLMTPRMLQALQQRQVSLIAVDEAHCISQWGPAFRPEYEALSQLKGLFPDVPIAAFTATADVITREDIRDKLFESEPEMFVSGFDRPNIHLAVEMKNNWKGQLAAYVNVHAGESGIVYCLSRDKTEKTALYLREKGVNAYPYHAGMDKQQRAANQKIFTEESGIVMVATIAFGMGIDKPDVRFVIHTDLPGSMEAYYQEIGRAGRDGLPASATMLYGLDDLRMRRLFIDQEEAGEARQRREHKRLDRLISYCEAPTCRRRVLLNYFGEEAQTACGNCDLCLNPVTLEDGTKDGQRVLSAVYRSGQRFGAVHIIDIVSGNKTEKVMQAGHDRLPTFGSGAHRTKNDWRALIRQLVAANFLSIDVRGYGGLKLTEAGWRLMRGEDIFQFRPDRLSRKVGGKKSPSPKSQTAAADLNTDDAELLQRLKALRLSLAKARNVPPYAVFHDKTLIEMARTKPRNDAEMGALHGVGAAKVASFSAVFLAELHKENAGFDTEAI